MKADLIIFDLDGTLINSIPDLKNALNNVSFRDKNFTEEYIASIVGGGVRKLVQDAFGISSKDDEFNEVFSKFLSFYAKNHSKESYLYGNVIEILEHFKSKKLAILSNKLDSFTKQIAKDFSIDKYFDLVLGANNDMEKKPSPEAINHILKKLKVSSHKAIMVGDSEADIMGAKNAGISALAVTYGYRSKESLKGLNPDYLIDNLTELKTIIE